MQGVAQTCQFSECTREDYLPSECSQCKKKFCNQHATQESHRCPYLLVPGLRTTVCPVCSEVLRVEAGESLDHAVNVHFDTGRCKLAGTQQAAHFRAQRQQQNQQHNQVNKVHICSLETCNETEAVPVECLYCSKKFCLKHKIPELHNCEKLYKVRRTTSPSTTVGVAAAATKPVDPTQGLLQATNTADTALGIRPGRNITDGDVLALVVYDAERLKRSLKPVFFSVSAITPVGRLLDAAVDHYPALPKTARYTIYSSVAIENTGTNSNNVAGRQLRHLIENQNMNIGDIYAVAAASGASWPATSTPTNSAVLAFCVSLEQQQQQQADGSNNSGGGGMVRSPTETAIAGAQRIVLVDDMPSSFCPSAVPAAPSAATQETINKNPPVASKAQQQQQQQALKQQQQMNSKFKPYVDAKGNVVHVLVDRSAVCGAVDKKKDDKCCCQ